MSSVCNICAESFNKSTRVVVKCFCDFECCRSCVQVYVLGTNAEPSCMSCKVQWTRQFLSDNLQKSVITKHLENILFEREQDRLQEVQPIAVNELEKIRASEKIASLEAQLIVERNKLVQANSNLRILHGQENSSSKFAPKKCPNSACVGFLSSSHICELCNCFACAHCEEITGFTEEASQQHVCDPNILESVKLIKNDSKPCPNCSSLIFKTHGCHHMFCVKCHTAFSWTSLKVAPGVIENPHYFEYLRVTNNGVVPRHPADVLCGRELDHNFLRRLLPVHPGFYLLCESVIHMQQVITRFGPHKTRPASLKLRVAYMTKQIDEQTFKKNSLKNENDRLKNLEIREVLTMVYSVMTDLFYRLLESNDAAGIRDEIHGLVVHANDVLKTVNKNYHGKLYRLGTDFVLY